MDNVTMSANETLPSIAVRNAQSDSAAALATIFHGAMIKVCRHASQRYAKR